MFKSVLFILSLLLSSVVSAADKEFSVTWAPTGAAANATAVTVEWYIDDVLSVSSNRSVNGTAMAQTLTVTNGQAVKCIVSFSDGVTTLSAEQTITAQVNEAPALQAPVITNLQQVTAP